MRVIVVGLCIQGRKRLLVADRDVVTTVDPVVAQAQFKSVMEVPLGLYDAAIVSTPDQTKIDIVGYLLSCGKHVLVEKPLLSSDGKALQKLARLAHSSNTCCYTAYNHRFEPHLVKLKQLMDNKTVGRVYLAKFFYGNGTARDVRNSVWRDQGS